MPRLIQPLLALVVACGSPPPTEPVVDPSASLAARGAEGDWNVVVVLSDALRAANVGVYGYPRATTPRIDALAAESLVFRHAFSHHPGTPLSVSQLLTGRYGPPLLMGARLFAVPVRELPDTLPVLPRVLSAAGFHTGLVSSHYWWTDDSRGLQAFDEAHIVPRGARAYAPFDELLPAVDRFLDATGERRFLLVVHSMDTHGPWTDPDPDLVQDGWPEGYGRLDTGLRRTDRGVAALVERLQARGVWDRTVFVFTSDHGDEFNEVGPEPWNRNHGIQVRRPLAEVPLVVRLPGARTLGERNEPVGLVDLAPTLAELARPGLGFPADGRQLAATWLSGAPGDPAALQFGDSGRFQAVYLPDRELLRDPWAGTDTLGRVERDPHNYPRVTPIHDDAGALVAALDRHRADLAAWDQTLPALPGVAHGAQIHVPFTVADGSVTPVFEDLPADGRWSHAGPALIAWPGEVGPVRFVQRWAPGRYRVVLALQGEDPSWNSTLRVGFDGQPPVAPRVEDEGRRGVLDEVVLEGRQFELLVDPGTEGVGLRSLTFYRLDGGDPGDPDLPGRLEALGYR